MLKNTAGKWVVFAFQDEGGANPGEPVTSGAAAITANLYLDGSATPNAVDDTNPTELGGGYYVFDVTAAETNADNIVIAPSSSTANVNVIGVPGAVYTTDYSAIADAFLNRDMSVGTDSGSPTVRTVRQALRMLRNKWSLSGTTLTVTKEDDTTASWTATVTATPGADPITASDPASS